MRVTKVGGHNALVGQWTQMWKTLFQFLMLRKPCLLFHPQKTLPHYQRGFLTTGKLAEKLGAPSSAYE